MKQSEKIAQLENELLAFSKENLAINKEITDLRRELEELKSRFTPIGSIAWYTDLNPNMFYVPGNAVTYTPLSHNTTTGTVHVGKNSYECGCGKSETCYTCHNE